MSSGPTSPTSSRPRPAVADSRRCTVCGRNLTDAASRARGTGPVCARKTRTAPLPLPPPRPRTRPLVDVPAGLHL
ncbi:DUF6011 domain-containing protein [Streptomyces sp. NPDC052179]|uniref:DUF6011 domain-containing protein n=1 Tax=Streptomyces sp. NPDC052179 TaxID=3155680 RepID=UPI003425829F